MRIEVLHVPDCPHLQAMLDRLAQVTDAPVMTRSIETIADAERYGMTGSPTLLVNGADPFITDARPSISCRLGGVPALEQLRSATAAAD